MGTGNREGSPNTELQAVGRSASFLLPNPRSRATASSSAGGRRPGHGRPRRRRRGPAPRWRGRGPGGAGSEPRTVRAGSRRAGSRREKTGSRRAAREDGVQAARAGSSTRRRVPAALGAGGQLRPVGPASTRRREPTAPGAGGELQAGAGGHLKNGVPTMASGTQLSEASTGLLDSNYLLNIRLIGNKKMRREFKCWVFEMVVDSDKTCYMDLVQSIVDKYLPGYLEVAYVQYYDAVLKTFPDVNSDQDLLTMFDVHNKKKVVQVFISYWNLSEPFVPITEWEFEEQEQPHNIEPDGDNYLSNPNPFNEHVGVDEEIMYLESVPVNEVVHEENLPNMDDDSDSGLDGENSLEDDLEEEEEVGEEEGYEEVNHHSIELGSVRLLR